MPNQITKKTNNDNHVAKAVETETLQKVAPVLTKLKEENETLEEARTKKHSLAVTLGHEKRAITATLRAKSKELERQARAMERKAATLAKFQTKLADLVYHAERIYKRADDHVRVCNRARGATVSGFQHGVSYLDSPYCYVCFDTARVANEAHDTIKEAKALLRDLAPEQKYRSGLEEVTQTAKLNDDQYSQHLAQSHRESPDPPGWND